jgi:hypothetical protein
MNEVKPPPRFLIAWFAGQRDGRNRLVTGASLPPVLRRALPVIGLDTCNGFDRASGVEFRRQSSFRFSNRSLVIFHQPFAPGIVPQCITITSVALKPSPRII